jgi:hypothetical protein
MLSAVATTLGAPRQKAVQMTAGPPKLRQLQEELFALVQELSLDEDIPAHPYLYLLNHHPAQVARFETLLAAPASLGGVGARISGSVRHFGSQVRLITRAARASLGEASSSFEGCVAALPPADVVIVSVLLSPDRLSSSEDFYFGRLVEELEQCGISALVVLRNHTARRVDARPSPVGERSARIVLPTTLPVAAEARLVARARRLRLALSKAAQASPRGSRRDLLRFGASRATAAWTVESLRMQSQFRSILARVQPRMLLTLFEGHAVERTLWRAAREVAPRAIRVGYQHATMWPHTWPVFRQLTDDGTFDPDVVVALGESSAEFVRSRMRDVRRPVVVFGSHRVANAVPHDRAARRGRTVLVVPEGYFSEMQILYGFVERAAMLFEDTHFIIRNHPSVDRVEFLRRYPGLSRSNVRVSEGRTLERDFEESSCCLYRGSSAVFAAVLAGLRPIYLHREGLANIDPLWPHADGGRSITSTEEFGAVMEMLDREPSASEVERWSETVRFCRRYIVPHSMGHTRELLRVTGLL